MPKLVVAEGETQEPATPPTETVETPAAPPAPEPPPTGSAVATSAPDAKTPTPSIQSSARAHYAAAKVDLAKIEQEISSLEGQREEVERVFQDRAASLTTARNSAIAEIDVQLADRNLSWQMVMQKCKIYETAAAQDLRT